jgi:hypothetical protein
MADFISFASEAKPELKLFVQTLANGCKMHIVATREGEPIACSFVRDAADC